MRRRALGQEEEEMKWSIGELIRGEGPAGDIIYNEADFSTEVVNSLFAYRPNITSVTMEEYDTNLPSFRQCSSLTHIYFPKAIGIGPQTFNGTNLSGTVYLNKMAPNIKTMQQSSFNGLNNVTRIILPETVTTINGNAFNTNMNSLKAICLLGTPTTFAANAIASGVATYVTDIYVPWSEGEVANAPWGATNATIHYNTVYDEDGNPIT